MEGGDDRRAQHEVGPVADERVDLALRRGELHAERPRDLVPHARIAVFDVVLLAVARPPELVEISRQRARGAHHHVRRRGVLVHRADDLALRRERLLAEGGEPAHPAVPLPAARRATTNVHSRDEAHKAMMPTRATMSGSFSPRMAATARSSAARYGGRRSTCQTRFARNASG